MRYTCQVTNQSSHGELSFHHNLQLRPRWGLWLYTPRVMRSDATRLKNAAHPTYCHCCELCALKQKPGVLLETRLYLRLSGLDGAKIKSQLQTVLITASGPQAYNALVHRERYTQGSRQNRCVSSQEALALRAKVKGNRKASVPLLVAVLPLLYWCSPPLHTARDLQLWEGYLPEGVNPPSPWHGLGSAASTDCQLRTAYGGESNCVIKT